MRNIESFTWGKACRKGHQKEDGTNLRYGPACVKCFCERDNKGDGLSQDELLIYLTSPKPPKRTPEEVAKMRSEASSRWNAKNKDKCKEYRQKYYGTDEYKDRRNAWYASLSHEEKKVLMERNKVYYERKKAEREANKPTAEERKQYLYEKTEEQKIKRREKSREAYAKLTPEEKKEIARKNAARAKAHTERNKDEAKT